MFPRPWWRRDVPVASDGDREVAAPISGFDLSGGSLAAGKAYFVSGAASGIVPAMTVIIFSGSRYFFTAPFTSARVRSSIFFG